jgi:hypothetical protein
MEQILKILKQLMATGGMLGNVPKPIKTGVLYFAVVVGVFVILKSNKLDQTTKTFLIVLLVLLAVITGIYFAWKAFTQKQQNKQFGGDISQHSSATPRGVSDPGQRARLDDMRKKFQSGIEAYKSRGKDLYKLPWYVIVGEPGSGKTEAIRHSNVGFPPGMQDEFQGVGGTINMNWWFTNNAVLLDTAGRLMFEEVKPGETSEWKEFLALLKKNRPNCPINGLFLVIPSDSLIKDSADSIQKKAGKIAQQLDVIQRVLDVRFPVFIAVTKCDKINGFREFFDTLTDPQLQHQMMGWSNPDPLDEPFKPEMVDKHLEQVAARLRRRRLGLLRDPIPENPDGKRTDEVDTLYALPHSLELLSSRLRRYLETIFVAGEWSAKPLFLRGIYFSSSMREGAALDAELAEAIGVSVDELPEGKVWERERAYFLRDVFLEKAFREKGLVTRATNTKRMLMGQQIALYSCGFVGLALFCVVAWIAMGSLRSGVKDQGDYWHVVSEQRWDNKFWKGACIVPIRGDGSFGSAISTNTLLVDGKTVSLGEFHAKLRDLAEKPLKKSMFFPLLADTYNKNRHNAQRIVFEAGVIRPLIEASRQKMMHDDGDPASAQREPDALAALIQIESDVLTRGTGTNKGTLSEDGARRFLSAFENYVAGADVPLDTNIVSVMAWTYSTNEAAKGSWAPRWFSGGRGGSNTLAVNSGISAGLDSFARGATNGIQSYVADWNQISSVRAAARVFADSEQALFTAAAGGLDDNFTKAEHAVEAARKSLDGEIAKASKSPVFAGSVSLTNALQKFQSAVGSSAGAAVGRVREVNEAALAANRDYALFKEIKGRLDGIQSTLSDRIKKLLEGGDPKEFQTLDDTCLLGNAFATRADLYAKTEKFMTDNSFGNTLVGLKGEPLEKVLKDGIGDIKTQVAAYSGKLTNEFRGAMTYQLKRVEKAQCDAFFGNYLAEVKKSLSSKSGFPLTRDLSHPITVENFKAAGKQLKYISDDFDSAIFKNAALQERPDWKGFYSNIDGQRAVANALLGSEGSLGNCTISLAGMSDATHAKDEWRGAWRDIKLIAEGSTGGSTRTEDEKDQPIGDAPVQQKIELLVYKNIGAPAAGSCSITTGEWGPLWLIHKYNGERDKTGNTWVVEVPISDLGASGKVRLKLKFERPLPELDKWST